MIHFFLILVCLISIEALSKLKILDNFYSIIFIYKKVSWVLLSGKISDHWKELVIPQYALKLMQLSLIILLTLSLIILFFLSIEFLYAGFIDYVISLLGVLESIIICMVYLFIKHKLKL